MLGGHHHVLHPGALCQLRLSARGIPNVFAILDGRGGWRAVSVGRVC
jgi:hypothetical protein